MEHPESLNIIQLIMDASLVVQLVMIILVLLSIFGWLLIFRLMMRFGRASTADGRFESNFWSGANLKVLYQHATNQQFSENLEGVFADGFTEHLKLIKKEGITNTTEATQRALRVSLQRKQSELENGLSVLASIGSVSPYIGLFGTVWGIMNAFIGLSAASQATLSSVAPGIAEALIATAMGLFAAIPAVLAFNHYTARAEKTYTRRALFCEELVGLIDRETKPVNTKQSSSKVLQRQQQAGARMTQNATNAGVQAAQPQQLRTRGNQQYHDFADDDDAMHRM